MFALPHGGVVNDYVPFYFSPITSFCYTIYKGNVDVTAPDGRVLGKSCEDERIFFVCSVDSFRGSGFDYCFSDLALTTAAPMPKVDCDLNNLETHVDWTVFDDDPMIADIAEVGYNGVCNFFANNVSPPSRQNRTQKRMAEFLVKSAVPLSMVTCIVAKTPAIQQALQPVMNASAWNIPILPKRGCYFS